MNTLIKNTDLQASSSSSSLLRGAVRSVTAWEAALITFQYSDFMVIRPDGTFSIC